MASLRSEAQLQAAVDDVRRLLDRHRLLESIAARQGGPKCGLIEDLQHRQNVAELQRRLRGLHPADVAHVLETLPLDDRRAVWEQVAAEARGRVFVEVTAPVRDSLVVVTAEDDLVALLSSLDAEDLAYVEADVPAEAMLRVSTALASAERSIYDDSVKYAGDTVGAVMTREWLSVPDTYRVEQAIADLRARGEIPAQTDRVFVLDARHVLVGAVPLQALLVLPPQAPVAGAMQVDMPTFAPFDRASDAAKAFERYDLISAPVVDDRGKLVGRLTVDVAMDVLQDEATLTALRSAGLQEDEDLFAAPLASARNRWPWLGINLVTAFVASRVIGQFEGTIESLSSLAALMPIVASIGGNTGNQTTAIVVRALARDRISRTAATGLMRKELVVSLLNGGVWGLVVGLFAFGLYHSPGLGLVMTGAVILNLLVAAVTGVTVPLLLHSSGRDPAQGSSVLLTFVTDAMGFFLFLGLAHVFLV